MTGASRVPLFVVKAAGDSVATDAAAQVVVRADAIAYGAMRRGRPTLPALLKEIKSNFLQRWATQRCVHCERRGLEQREEQ